MTSYLLYVDLAIYSSTFLMITITKEDLLDPTVTGEKPWDFPGFSFSSIQGVVLPMSMPSDGYPVGFSQDPMGSYGMFLKAWL